MRPLSLALCCAAAASFAVGCPTDDDTSNAQEAVLSPVAAGDRVLVADRGASELVSIRVADGELVDIARLPLSGSPDALLALPDGSGVLALNRDTETLDLTLVATDERRSYALGAPFSAITASPDSEAAIGYFPPGTATTVFHNTNEIAFVDLRAGTPPTEAVTRRTLASLGGAPRGVFPSPLVGGRRYAFILSDEHVAVMDLTDPEARERSVPLVSLNTGGTRTPLAVSFAIAPDASLWAVVTTQEGNSVYALNVFEQAPTEPGEPDFEVRLTQLAGFSAGGQVELVRLPDGRLVTVMISPAQGTATITELSNGASEQVMLGNGVNRVQTYFEDGRPIAVVFARGGTAFHILDVATIEEKGQKAFRTRFARQPIQDLLPVPNTPLFFAFHPDTDAGVSVINADTDRVTAFGRTGTPVDVVLSLELGRVYVLTRLASEAFVVSVSLDNLHPESSPAPPGSNRLLVLPQAGTVVASAPLAGGQLVLWPAFQTFGDAAFGVPGFLLDGLFDRTQ